MFFFHLYLILLRLDQVATWGQGLYYLSKKKKNANISQLMLKEPPRLEFCQHLSFKILYM